MTYLRKLFLMLLGLYLFSHSFNVFAQMSTSLLLTKSEYIKDSVGQIEFFRFGSGSPILLISGYGTTLSSWNRQFLAALAQKHEVIIFNNRGIGGSIVRSNQYAIADLANDAYRLIQLLQLPRVSVAGISMGGMIAQQLAILHPKVVSHLILINTAVAGRESLRPKHFIEESLFHPPRNPVARFVTGIDILAPPAWRIRMAIALERERFIPRGYHVPVITQVILAQQQQLILNWSRDDNAAAALSKLPMPVLILSGGSDEVIPPANSDILAKTIPRARLLRWPDGGHAMIYQYPIQLATAINDFIK